ncbi:hypothetical protein Ahy_B01g056943 [Arachis hypogaea]|uniref:Uncharacterized protein n=1 Tax=Arachis hypogaea TaxID=3818 RepID=A0A445B007_ARAHY|nr:hypothetical protein Ahy_B01g056943 [Arachis hypogaea]
MYDRLNPTRGGIKPEFYDKVCSIYNRWDGSCIECRIVNCLVKFHPWCAHQKVMAPRVKGKGVKGHRDSCTTTAAAISTTSTSSNFQSGPLSQQSYLMVPNPGYTGLPLPSWPTAGCIGPPPPPFPPILIPPMPRNSSLLVYSETPGNSSTSSPSETASVPNSVTKERLVPDEKISWLPFPPGSQKITEIIKKRYDKSYKKFGDVPLPTKKFWFKVWKSHFLIDDDDDEFFGGLSSIGQKKQLGRTPTHEEAFKETHTLKSDKSKWVDKRSQDTHIHNLNEELFQRVTQQTDERISKLFITHLAPLEKTQKKL